METVALLLLCIRSHHRPLCEHVLESDACLSLCFLIKESLHRSRLQCSNANLKCVHKPSILQSTNTFTTSIIIITSRQPINNYFNYYDYCFITTTFVPLLFVLVLLLLLLPPHIVYKELFGHNIVDYREIHAFPITAIWFTLETITTMAARFSKNTEVVRVQRVKKETNIIS